MYFITYRLQKAKSRKAKPRKGSAGVVANDTPGREAIVHPHADKAHLANVRVIQRNLVYVIGLVAPYNTEEV